MTVDTNKLRELATAATQPGPWAAVNDGHGRHIVIDCNGMWVADVGEAPADAAFIAAANPAVVLELIDDNDQLRAACATWQSIFTGFPHDAQQALRDLREKLAAITAARDELAGLARFMWTYSGQVSQAVMNDVERLAAIGKEQQ